MPNMKDAQTLVVGDVIDVSPRTDSDRKQTGFQVKLIVREQGTGPGFLNVNIRLEEAALLDLTADRVVWMVRAAPYDITDERGRNAGMSVRFVREVTENDLDMIVSSLPATARK